MTPQELIVKVKEIVPDVYLVGGSVRDMLLSREPKDYDFTTPLSPDDVEARVKAAGRHVYAIGKKFGTIGFKIMDGATPYYVEVTTYRSEQYEPGNRKPQVVFVDDLKEDLSRRDFTINAIAYDGENYIDPFGGRIDILSRKIKAVGNAKDRFKEDPLRMLRAARFSAQLGFQVDPNMIGFMRKMARSIYTVSRERWTQELDKLLLAPRVDKGMGILYEAHLLRYMLPELALLVETNAMAWQDTMAALRQANEMVFPHETVDDRWDTLLYSVGLPFQSTEAVAKGGPAAARDISKEVAKGIAGRLKFSNDRTEAVTK